MPLLNVEELISQLTLDEKISLLSGKDFWHTIPVHRLGIPSIRFSDGPNGIRGTRFFNGVPAACFPCGTGLGATWDEDLIHSGGKLMGEEAKAKGATVILGPTVNIQRSPLGGRGFESFSEDPFLSGSIAAATINGIQSTGVAATIKHLVCNDQEHERQAVSSVVSERALREIYLLPFQIAQRDSKPWALMTSYNRVNGIHCSQDKRLIQDILRDEWGFDGLTMSDWFGTYSTVESIKAGLDIEMPGPAKLRGQQVHVAVTCKNLFEHTIDDRVRNVLNLVNKVAPAGVPEDAPEEGNDTKETAALLRQIGAASQVLLKNENKVLPFDRNKTIAVIGPNAKFAAISGGGSASLRPYYAVTPYDAIKAQSSDVKYAIGAAGYKYLPILSNTVKTSDGKPGFTAKAYAGPPSSADRKVLEEMYIEKSNMTLMDYKPPNVASGTWYIDLEATLTPEDSGDYDFGLYVCGTAKLFIDGKLIIDNETDQKPGDTFFGTGTREEFGSMKLESGKTYKLLLQFGSAPTSNMRIPGVPPLPGGGLRLGGTRKIDPQVAIDEAVKLAKEVDQVVVVAGLSSDWECEGYDRPTFSLPGHTDALISAISAANPRTSVVIQSGTPVGMPWANSVPSIVQSWYGGNETGNAIADVLFGAVNPSAKLPLSMPVRNEDNPAFLNFRSERGRTLYGEDVYVGYRFYEKTKKDVLFPFGHGLSYTTFEMSNLAVAEDAPDAAKDVTLKVLVDVKNTGEIAGAQVVQVYVSQQAPSINRPPKELKGFKKVHLKPGETQKVEIIMSKKYATSFWDEERDMWIMEKGDFDVLVGDSSAATPLRKSFKVEKTGWWKGL